MVRHAWKEFIHLVPGDDAGELVNGDRASGDGESSVGMGFFVPFIIIATFTILNLFIGIIVSTMQELSMLPEPGHSEPELEELLERMEADLKVLRTTVDRLRGTVDKGQ